jgi:activator of 2-hydroxyglutaryl-CoA dehydratase
MTGGVAKNKGVVNALARILGKRIKEIKPLDPQLTGALGAALIAAEKAGKEKSP